MQPIALLLVASLSFCPERHATTEPNYPHRAHGTLRHMGNQSHRVGVAKYAQSARIAQDASEVVSGDGSALV